LPSNHPAPIPRFRFQLIAATFTRLVLNTAQRMVYPFLPEIGRGLGVPLESLTLILSMRAGLGMTAPLFGGLADRYGRRLAMLAGLAVFCGAMAWVGLFPAYLTFGAAVILVVVAKFIFDPALQAYLSDRTPYSRRGLVIALSEVGWSGAALAGIPLVGLAMARGGWQAPFLPLAAVAFAAGAGLYFWLPRDRPGAGRQAQPGRWATVFRSKATLAAVGVSALIAAANESLNVVYGAWMEQAFQLPVAALGLSTTVIGLAELAGEGLVMALADRLGKRRVIGFGLAASGAAYLALPFLAARLEYALAGLFLVFITFEFTIVATLPLITELAPEARSRVLSAAIASHAGGRMVGALIGGYLFRLGFVWNGAAALALNVLALALLIGFVREQH
jgi:predicted MFS family arabinose efflux permease